MYNSHDTRIICYPLTSQSQHVRGDIPGMKKVFFINVNTRGLGKRSTASKALCKQGVMPGAMVYAQRCQVTPAVICTHPEARFITCFYTLQIFENFIVDIINRHKETLNQNVGCISSYFILFYTFINFFF